MVPSKHERLNAEEEKFCLLKVTPDEHGKYLHSYECYLHSHRRCRSEKYARNSAAVLMQRPRILSRIAELRSLIAQEYLHEKAPFTAVIDNVVNRMSAGDHGDQAKAVDQRIKLEELLLRMGGQMPPEKHELSGPGAGPIEHGVIDLSQFTAEQLEALRPVAELVHARVPEKPHSDSVAD